MDVQEDVRRRPTRWLRFQDKYILSENWLRAPKHLICSPRYKLNKKLLIESESPTTGIAVSPID